jgi:hypothetical protein
MLDRCADVLQAALLLSYFLPLLAWYSILAAYESRRAVSKRSRVSAAYHFKQTAGEFNFERAIEAYEELIDSTFAEGRL